MNEKVKDELSDGLVSSLCKHYKLWFHQVNSLLQSVITVRMCVCVCVFLQCESVTFVNILLEEYKKCKYKRSLNALWNGQNQPNHLAAEQLPDHLFWQRQTIQPKQIVFNIKVFFVVLQEKYNY